MFACQQELYLDTLYAQEGCAALYLYLNRNQVLTHCVCKRAVLLYVGTSTKTIPYHTLRSHRTPPAGCRYAGMGPGRAVGLASRRHVAAQLQRQQDLHYARQQQNVQLAPQQQSHQQSLQQPLQHPAQQQQSLQRQALLQSLHAPVQQPAQQQVTQQPPSPALWQRPEVLKAPRAPLPSWWTDPFASASAAAVAASAGGSNSSHAAAYMTSTTAIAAPGPPASAASAHMNPALVTGPHGASAKRPVDPAAKEKPDVPTSASVKRPFLPPRRSHGGPASRDASTPSIREIIASRDSNLSHYPEVFSRTPAQLALPATHASGGSAASALQAATASPRPGASESVLPDVPARLPCLTVRFSTQPPEVLCPKPDSSSFTTMTAAAGTASTPSSSQMRTAAKPLKHEVSSLKMQPQTGPDPQRNPGAAQDGPQGSVPAMLLPALRQTAEAAAEAPELLWSPPSHVRNMHSLGASLLDSPDLQDGPGRPKGRQRDPSGSKSIQDDGHAFTHAVGEPSEGPFSSTVLEPATSGNADAAKHPGTMCC